MVYYSFLCLVSFYFQVCPACKTTPLFCFVAGYSLAVLTSFFFLFYYLNITLFPHRLFYNTSVLAPFDKCVYYLYLEILMNMIHSQYAYILYVCGWRWVHCKKFCTRMLDCRLSSRQQQAVIKPHWRRFSLLANWLFLAAVGTLSSTVFACWQY